MRDGKVEVDKLSITGKILVSDRFENVLASTQVLVASIVQATGTTLTLSTAPDVPRAIKICNAGQAQFASTRRFKVVGYDAKGDYTTEIVTAPIGTSGVIRSNNAYSAIGSVTPIDDRVVTNYGTFAITFADRLGLSHPLSSKLDIKGLTRYSSGAPFITSPATTSANLLASATNKYISITYDTIETGATADNCTGSTMVVRYLTEFQ